MSKNQTIVEFKGSEIAINNDNYYNAQSIKLNPIVPVFIVSVVGVRYPLVLED